MSWETLPSKASVVVVVYFWAVLSFLKYKFSFVFFCNFHRAWAPAYQLCEPMYIMSEIGVLCTTTSRLSNFRRDCNDPFDHMVLRLHLGEDVDWGFHHVALFTKCIESEKEMSRKKGAGQTGIRTWEMDEEVSTGMGERVSVAWLWGRLGHDVLQGVQGECQSFGGGKEAKCVSPRVHQLQEV